MAIDPYKELANAIVLQAVKDYKKAYAYSIKHPQSTAYASEVKRLEDFFKSEWYGMLTSLDSQALLKQIRANVKQAVLA